MINMDKRNKILLIVVIAIIGILTIFTVITKAKTINSNKLVNFAKKNNYILTEENIYVGKNNFLNSFINTERIYDSNIKINASENTIEGEFYLDDDSESLNIIYNLDNNVIVVSYINKLYGILYDELTYNYKTKEHSCIKMLDNDKSFCGKLIDVSNKFKAQYSI